MVGETSKTSSVPETRGIHTVPKSKRLTKEAEMDWQERWDPLGPGWPGKASLRRQVRRQGGDGSKSN